MRKLLLILIFLGVIVVSAYYAPAIRNVVSGIAPIARPAPALPADDKELPFIVPDGFAVSVFSRDLPGARVLTRDFNGTLVATLTSKGRVVALPDSGGDHKADRVVDIITGLNNPHGILFRCDQFGNDCRMYVAEENAVLSYEYDADTSTATLPKDIASLPTGGGHSTRTLLAHPDGKRLLISIGSSCNVCDEVNFKRAKIFSLEFLGSAFEEPKEFASGLRNTVFMAIHPVTGEIWGTDMGRDLLGDDTPPDEINILRENSNYGWPICYGKNIHDTDFDNKIYIRNPCMEPFEIPSHIDIPAHSAPLGIAFIPEEGWPEEYWHDALVAYHGSWNRSTPTGYKIVKFDLDPNGTPTNQVQDFMTGFISDGSVIGRPVDILVEPGGTIYVTDDRAGAIYRIYRTHEQQI